ncbi:Peptidase family M28 [Porphyromonadaceae bacterium NLAE-zl-C104]|nr:MULTISPECIES: M28 family peptidase [Proteiniphilum]MDY9919566.1 M28 family peptidase [Proteiniphilum sp.]SEA27840.1 Peptidase family M28 [Porphyromonadaceae bacterium KH3R12]SFT04334.1 Peptidase family M28 [Porphyromonadaceae bacterium NLAE-zl-C104]
MQRAGNFFLLILLIAGVMFSISCNSCQSSKYTVVTEPYLQISPDFNADSAYSFVEKQLAFGSRVPGTTAHQACGDYLAAKLTEFGAQVTEQKADITHYDGKNLTLRNIIGSYYPEKEKRILLFAHWDTRPFADEESDAGRQQQPIAGADDGASGVGTLLEIARNLQQYPVEVGVDIIFFDLEDWGQPSFDTDWVQGEWWCLGSRYWSEQPHVENYKADYGILLDMVGAANATFLKEGYSMKYAPNILDKVWSTAAKLGHGNYFLPQNGGYITDDHLSVNQHQRAPSINIINLKTDTHTGFASHWHTHRDDMRNIDRGSLKAAGQTVMEVIYTEKGT